MEKERIVEIDWLRGFAILLMTFTHVSAMFYTFDNPYFSFFSHLGGQISYTIFLYCFAFGLYISYKPNKTPKYIKKSLNLLLIYYLLALAGFFALQVPYNPSISFIKQNVLQIITLQKLVPYSEFFVTFPIYLLFITIYYRCINYLLQSQKRLLFITVPTEVIAIITHILVSQIPYNYLLTPLYLLVGYKDYHYFPILFYMPIFLLGTYTGKVGLIKLKNLIFFILVTVIFSLGLFMPNYWFQFNRFPPTPFFLIYGITWCIGILVIFSKLLINKKSRALQTIASILQYLGQNTQNSFVIHTLIIFLLYFVTRFGEFLNKLFPYIKQFTYYEENYRTNSIITIIITYLVTIWTTYLIVHIKNEQKAT